MECLPTSPLGSPSLLLVRVHLTLTGSLVGSCLLPRSTLDCALSTRAPSQTWSPHVRLWAELHDLCWVPTTERPFSRSIQYQVGQLYSVAEASKNETGGGEGIQVLCNEPYQIEEETGQFTHKIYHLQSKVPSFIRMLAPEGSLTFHEKAWNAFPYCRTVITNEYMKDSFFVKIETWHKPDMGNNDNVHGLDAEKYKEVEIVNIDIADRTQVHTSDYKTEEDPALFHSEKVDRGPLTPDWKKELASDSEKPHMCAYKLVTVYFKWWGLQNKVESLIHKQERRIFTNFHRQLFCWIDHWIDLNMDDIRRMEEETQKELEEMRRKGQVRGTSAAKES